MRLKEIINKSKKEKEIVLLGIAILQIFLLVSITPTSSHLIKQYDNPTESLIIREKNNKGKIILRGLVNLLIGALSIKQIGVVSAQEVSEYCCPNTCDLTISINPTCPNNIEPIPTSCDATDDCKKGCCFDTTYGLCTPSSPKGKCTSPGEWSTSVDCSINECRKGCCVLGSNVQFTTERNCEFISSSQGFTKDFRQIWNELDCLALTATQDKGACISGTTAKNCDFTTEDDCLNNINGVFYENYLCSHPDIVALGINCVKQDHIDCVDGKDEIYWFDSCDNRENIYSSDRDTSWNNGMVLSKELSCGATDDDGNIDSTTCGNCPRPFSKCSETSVGETHVTDGNFVCRDLSCKNAPANGPPGTTQDRISGEKWCLYDGFIGEGKDTVGSEHWLAHCNGGVVEIDPTDNPYRGEICQEQTTTDQSGKSFTQATHVTNDAPLCLTYNPKIEEDMSEDEIETELEKMNTICNANKQCMVKNIDIDEYFKFDFCVPKYPKGANLIDGLDDNFCGDFGSASCKVYYQKKIGGWECIENCDCEKREFAEKMNDFCISLGDCGSYVNYLGGGTDNIKIEGKKGKKLDSDGKETDKKSECKGLRYDKKGIGEHCEKMDVPSVSWQDYISKATPEAGQYVEPQNIDEFLSSIMGTSFDYSVEAYSKALNWIGYISGASGTGIFTVAGFLKIDLIGMGTTAVTASQYGIGITAGAVISAFATVFATTALGMSLGYWIGRTLGRAPKITTFLMITSGITGLIIGLTLIGVNLGPAWWIALVIDALIIFFTWITGLGKRETRIVEFSCMPWQAPTFSDFNTAQSNCRKCNEDPLRPCTEYRCSSLGQTCRILNPNEENPDCESISYEPNPPVISEGEITTAGYQFSNVQPKSVEIISTESSGCIQELTSVSFTLNTDEPAECKWSFEKPTSYSYKDMEGNYPLEQNAFTKEHTFNPQMQSLDSEYIYNIIGTLKDMKGYMNMYVRCQDYWENANIDEYIVKFCITRTDETVVNHGLTIAEPRNGDVLKYGTMESPLTIWINEPADCRYDSVLGKNYDDMTGMMDCNHDEIRPHINGWPCSTPSDTPLTNLVAGENKFYIKCKDKPWVITDDDKATYGDRNVNPTDYEYILFVTETELKIDSITFSTIISDETVKINSGETIKTGLEPISVDMEVTTSGGANNGEATCSWGVLQDGSRWPFFNTFSNTHTQLLSDRMRGTYNIYIECIDEAENEVEATGQFTIFVDSDPPQIVRAFRDGSNLKIITDEQAKCYYSLKSCSFNFEDEDVFSMTTLFSIDHTADWNAGQTYYIKCEDVWNNKNTDCAIRISPSDLI